MSLVTPEWQAVIDRLGLRSFETVWNLPLDMVDEPNRARGGWSEVGRVTLDHPVSGSRSLYIKRQENFTYRPLNAPWTRRPTFEREYHNLCWCLEHDVPAVKPLVFMRDTTSADYRAILITIGLDDYVPLSAVEKSLTLSMPMRRRLIKSIASQISHMHEQGLQHACLYSKHIFVHSDMLEHGEGDIRLIDLEKGRPLSMWNAGIFRDLDSLNRHAVGWSLRERIRFLKHYPGKDTERFRELFHKLNNSYKQRVGKSA